MLVKKAAPAPELVAQAQVFGVFRAGEAVEPTADQVAHGVAAEGKSRQANHVDYHDEGTQADAELAAGKIAVPVGRPPEGLQSVPRQQDQENQGDVHEITVQVLQDERQAIFTPVRFSGFADRTGRGIGPEGPVIRLAVVITGEAEKSWKGENQKAGGEGKPARQPGGTDVAFDPSMMALAIGVVNQRREKWGKVGGNRLVAGVMKSLGARFLTNFVTVALPGGPGAINKKRGQPDQG